MASIMSIYGENQVNECDEIIIEEEFFTFLNSYGPEGNDSLLAQTGKELGLNLEFLADFSFDEDEFDDEFDEEDLEGEENRGIRWLNTKETISVIENFILKVRERPKFYESLSYNDLSIGFMDKDNFGKYVDKQLLSDLETVKRILECFDKNGTTQVYITFC